MTVGTAAEPQTAVESVPESAPADDGSARGGSTDSGRRPIERVVVLAGGLSHEREVSLRSGRRVADALRSAGIDVTIHDVDADLLPYLAREKPDAVWPLLHGARDRKSVV